jgi:hypothetical protein
MANEFKIKKGLIVTGASGGTVVEDLDYRITTFWILKKR